LAWRQLCAFLVLGLNLPALIADDALPARLLRRILRHRVLLGFN
jgi:hypothetical protein